MDRMLNSKQEKETIYEIYRGCRLCGGGAGYKMPIIQNIIDFEDSDVELRQKIRECVQIEVHQDDKMPPLICELCVDKVNDFYEFLDMCRQTNKKTRLRLGLPPQSMPRGAPDAGDCILGLTEPVYVEDSDGEGELLAKNKKTKIKMEPGLKEIKKEVEVKRVKEVKKETKKETMKEPVVCIQLEDLNESRSSRHNKRPRTPPRVTRLNRTNKDDEEAVSSLKEKTESPKVTPRSILKRDSSNSSNSSRRESKAKDWDKGESESDDSSTSRKRLKDKQPAKLETPSKRVKITIKPPQPPGQKPSPKPSPKPVKRAPTPPPKEDYNCTICGAEYKTPQARSNHLRIHTVGFTSPKLACNPCGEWFSTADEISSHHKRHKSIRFPYSCRNCYSEFKRLSDYEEHLEKNECIPAYEVPDIKCEECWHLFPTHNLFDSHKCLGADHRPGGKCDKCNRNYVLLKNLKKHESTCTAIKKGQPIVDEEVLKKLLPMQVRISRCDSILKEGRNSHCNTSNLPTDFGLDPACFYPYLGLVRIKSEFKGMVNIVEDFKEFAPEDYIHWDSTDDESDDEITCSDALNSVSKKKKVESLTALCLKSIFSKKLLGKVPRKKRKFKPEKVFDYLNDDVKMDLDNIINNLGDDEMEYKKDNSDFDNLANENNDARFKFNSLVNDDSANASSKRNSDENNDSSLPKVNGDINVSNDKNNGGYITDCKAFNSDTNNASVTSQNDKKSQEKPSEVTSLDFLLENNSQDTGWSKNGSSNKNCDAINGDLDLKLNVENNDSFNDNTNNDSSNSSSNSKIVLSDILPKSTENEVTVSSINNFSFDF